MLSTVLSLLRETEPVSDLLARVRRGQPVRVRGASGAGLAALLSLLQQAARRPLAVALPAETDLETLLLDVRAFHAHAARGAVVAFPPLDVDPYGDVPPHDDIVRERLQTLDRCVRERVDILLAPIRCWSERIQAPATFRRRALCLRVGDARDPDDLEAALVQAGYRRVTLVEELGEYARRGGIVDLFPPTREHPVRVEFFGDAIESLREFNPRDQRSMRTVESIELPPASADAAPSTAQPAAAGGAASRRAGRQRGRTALLTDYLKRPLYVEVDPEMLAADAAAWAETLEEQYHRALATGREVLLPEQIAAPPQEVVAQAPGGARVVIEQLAAGEAWPLRQQAAGPFRGRLAELAREVHRAMRAGDRVVFLMSRAGKAERLAEILAGYGVRAALALAEVPTALPAGTCWIGTGELSAGVAWPDVGFRLWTDVEVFGRARPVGRRRRFHGEAFEGDFRDLAPGDLVIHEEHGIGRFVGVKEIEVGGARREFMEIEYRDAARLYVPLDQLYLVQKFRAGEDARPRLDALGGTNWQKVKQRVKRSLRDVAAELLELYAARRSARGYAFGPDTPWQRELEDSFEYEETPDQLAAIAEVKADMESDRVMDRLLCGDVGYGKTEVAVRAAFKAVMEGKQVAFLAPTTVLAHQHWRTLRERLAAFPVRVELLSRFRDPAELRAAAKGIREGGVDIAVGTHRLLSRDIRFKDLGLLVIDEEQRFGVAQKEKLKRLKREVDALAMTATPIPRTLQMSLLGVRDLSVIETPPKDRYAIATHIVGWDRDLIANAIHEELSRNGQVFFVHNRIESIYRVARAVQEMVPAAELRVAHGRLRKAQLERVMLDFVEGRADILVTTAIIENGLDIPLANTIVINRADRFGLAQLYQLRGRVGRSTRRAYAYLIVPPVDTLSPVAKRRLRAIQEFADLGSGFRLAATDLEIRGAGSLLGERQHGHIAAVGFEMYARLLEEAVAELKGEPAPAEARAQIQLGVELEIPADYIDDPIQRLTISKRLGAARSDAQLEALQQELRDRYGPLPEAMERLFAYASLRLAAEELGVLAIERQGDRVGLRIAQDARVDRARILERITEGGAWRMAPPDRLSVAMPRAPVGELLAGVRSLLDELR